MLLWCLAQGVDFHSEDLIGDIYIYIYIYILCIIYIHMYMGVYLGKGTYWQLITSCWLYFGVVFQIWSN